MLAESLETMRKELLHVTPTSAAGPGAAAAPRSDPRDLLSGMLDDLSAALRRGGVEPAPVPGEHADAPCFGPPTWPPALPDDAVVRAYRLLGDRVHDLVEEGKVEASPRELRILSDWLAARQAAQALAFAVDAAERSRTLAALLDAVPDAIAAVQPDGSIHHLNRAALELARSATGRSFAEIASGSWRDVGYATDGALDSSSKATAGEYDAHMTEAIAGATVTTEILSPTPNGARWFEYTFSPVHHADGTLASVAVVGRDIHDRKRAQTSLSLFSKIAALAGTLDYEEVLSAVARLSIPELADWCVLDVVDERGTRRAEVAHRDPAKAPLVEAFRRFPLDHPARRRMPAARAVETGRPVLIPHFSEEMLREMTDDPDFLALGLELGPCSEIVIPVPLSGSVATMLFFVTVESGRRYGQEDVALAEELVRRAAQLVENARAHQKLRQTEERFRVALAHSNITLFEQDAESRYRWVYNPPPGFDAAEALGKSNDELFPPEEAARVSALDRAVLESGERIQEEIRITSPRGAPLHFLLSQEPLRDAAGAIVGLTGAATDITDQKRAQEALSRAVAYREQMMGVLGHDLRSPLGAVRVLATLLSRREDLPESARESLLEIDRAGKRMLEMIGTLLDFSESRFTGSLPIAPVPMDLHATCRLVVEELRAAEPDRTIEVELEGDGRGTWDAARMAQVVSNLVANALKHGARHEPVRVSVGGDEEDVVLKVANQGPPIAPALMAVLFEPFCRGSGIRDASHARGLGLGLFIARQIVNAHGGTISVESTEARGTTFTVSVPRARIPRSEEARQVVWGGGGAAGAGEWHHHA